LRKVKRMNTARIVVLAIPLAAGGLAIHLVGGPEPKPVVQAAAVQIETVDVPVAKSDIPIGQTVSVAKAGTSSGRRPDSGVHVAHLGAQTSTTLQR
jgi:Flp pilus assembly protein CpaB